MIIIKSQDGKSIRKYGSINMNYQNPKEIIGIPTSPIVLINLEQLDNDEAHYVLGNYKTKEQAKEVMEEIEGHIIDVANQAYWMAKFPEKELTNPIYTMPKE